MKDYICLNGKKIELSNETVRKIKKIMLPKSWEELVSVEGYCVDDNSVVNVTDLVQAKSWNSNIFPTEELAWASVAVAQLAQLREVYRDGWEPDWTTDQKKYCIFFEEGFIVTRTLNYLNQFLSFQTQEIRNQFLYNFKDLIEEAAPILG